MKHTLLFLLIFLVASSFAQKENLITSNFSYTFIENKGQIIDQNRKPNAQVLYLVSLPGMNIQLRKNGFSYDTYTVEKNNDNLNKVLNLDRQIEDDSLIKKPSEIRFHRVDVDFIESNCNSIITAEDKTTDYLNYYNEISGEKGITNISQFQKVVYHEIYPNIDLEFLIENEKLKFNFILKQGADINQIQWRYLGQNGIKLSKGNIEIQLKNGAFTESIPASFLEENAQIKPIKIVYKQLGENRFGFNCGQKNIVNSGQRVIIDPIPEILWGTYFGGSLTTESNSVSVDSSNNIFIAGYTMCVSNFATSGAFQSVFNAAGDAFIAKFNATGSRIWSTYYGGSLYEEISHIYCTKENDIVVAGLSKSSQGISTVGSFQPNLIGGIEFFFAKFSNSGYRIWASYYGGSYNETYPCLALDSIGNIFIGGRTLTDTAYMATAGAYQISIPSTTGFGNHRCFLAKFNSNGNRIWGTYIRATSSLMPLIMATDKFNNILIGGRTTSLDSISTPGVFQTVNVDEDGICWLMKFNSIGQKQWGTYYGGILQLSSNEAYPYGLTTDVFGNIFMSGNTESTTNMASLGAHKSTLSGNTDGFLVKFNANGTRNWGTYYGGNMSETIFQIKTDHLGNIYCLGGTTSAEGIATPNTMKPLLDSSNGDGFIAKFNTTGQRIWGSYYGGNKGEYYRSLIIDYNGKLVFTGKTISTTGIATNGAFQTSQGSNGVNYSAFIARLSDCKESDSLSVSIASDTICYGQGCNLIINGALNDAAFWNVYSDTVFLGNTTTNNFSINPTKSSNYIVRSAGGCPIIGVSDTVSIFVHNPSVFAGNDTSFCKGKSMILNATGSGTVFNWSNSLSNGSVFTPDHDSALIVTMTDTNACNKSDTLLVIVHDFPFVNAGSDTSVCSGSNFVLHATGTANIYLWNTALTNGDSINPITNQILVVMGVDSNNCAQFDTLQLSVLDLPYVTYINSFHQICVNHLPRVLMGGLPQNGIYSGSGVNAGVFNPQIANLGWNNITYSYADSLGCSNFAIDSVYLDACIGLNEVEKDGTLSIFPNPATDFVTLDYSIPETYNVVELEITDITGKVIQRKVLKGGINQEIVSVENLASGTYLMILKGDNLIIASSKLNVIEK